VRRLLPLCSATSVVLVVLGILAGPASAAIVTPSPSCTPATTEPFAAFGDTNDYFLVPGGSFESGGPAWNLSGGAVLAAGNNTAGSDPSTNVTSLSLPSGGSATSPSFCVSWAAPTMRFFLRNTGAASSRLGITEQVTFPNGFQISYPFAQLTASKSWGTTLMPLPFGANLLAALFSPTGSVNVAFQFRPLDASGQWRIDDVYVDPFKHK
jgi:hypothetical protein